MINREIGSFVLIAESKSRASDRILATSAAHQAAGKSSFAAAKVGDQLNDFAAAQFTSDLLAELLGIF